jgi:IS30 family transposase
VFSVISPTGGIRPATRRRAPRALSLGEREEISRGLSAHCSLRRIASLLGRSPSTISREILRNGGPDRYRAARSDHAAWDRALRPKPCKLACRPLLARTVSAKLQRKWSPEQIAGWLKRAYPGEPHNQVSHETIYRSLFIQTRGVLKKELLEHLRAKRTIRRSRHASLKRNGLGQIKDAVSISERPASVEDRAIPGHWEGDLIGGCKNSYVATLVERHSRYVMLIKVANKDTESVVSALIKQSRKLPGELYRSLTWDRGKELADHKRLALASDVEVYFCDPRSPWQRGSNENTNRLLRQYLPHGTDLSLHSQAKLSAIARQLNERPRKTWLYKTPAETFAECVAASS